MAFLGHTHCPLVDIIRLLLRDGGDWALFYLLFTSRFVFTRRSYVDKLGSFMRTKHKFVLIHIRNKDEVGAIKHRSLKFGPYITYIASKPKAHGVIT